jgi:hypothetical protein
MLFGNSVGMCEKAFRINGSSSFFLLVLYALVTRVPEMWLNSLCFLERWRSHSVMRFIGSRRRVSGKIRG